MDQDEPVAIGDEMSGAVCVEPGLVQGARVGILE